MAQVFRNFLAGRQQAQDEDAYENSLAQQEIGNARDSRLMEMRETDFANAQTERTQQQEQAAAEAQRQAVLRASGIAKHGLKLPPEQRKPFLQRTIPVYSKDFALLGEDTSDMSELLAQSDADLEADLQQLAAFSQDEANEEGYGQPQSVVGPDGRTQLVQFGNRGGARPVEGYRPNPLEQYGRVNPGDYTPESLAKYAQTGNFSDLVRIWAPVIENVGNVPTAIDRTVGVGGSQAAQRPLSTLEREAAGRATVAGAEAAAKTGGQIRAETQANALAGLADLEAETTNMTENITGLINSPGFSTIYGASAVLDPRSFAPGTEAANARARLEQLSAQAFQAAIQKMRGLGALSEAEGKKVSAAYTRATNTKQTDEAAREAWIEVITRLNAAQDRARRRATVGPTAPQAPAADVEALLNKYAPRQ